ncbi:MAG: hypothetical protein A2X13_10050 [Bacteroidetes bacterium GWC2_33_15]|nr:MAG: hypothetical protein A2X10_02605 [Bacteroidetes bacterium GWA2_33_15]OFX48749.1 MAG: hypothetical protein A2X13_10050 [Bacteroidetes bacterium GWC2_33_15]OFX65991.1 MAG: hypothetical protein A2X15_11200 [Bacteroidetes bacterium GWB2_32_14]OFX68248.1 MAG: hypothetical protein A2X14_07695 [Bacteroidetes bacterium GWD2_33_33]HAN18026.1 hypothetical protein [Bacteroidales bacterium]
MNELLTCISNLFKKYGIKSVTMDDIARELGISKKTLYLHFENKNDIVDKVAQFEIKNEFDELNKLYTEKEHIIDQLLAISKYLVEKICKTNSSILYSMSKYYPQILEETMGKRKKHIIDLITNNFNIGAKQGFYRKEPDFEIILFFYSFLLDIKSIDWYSDWFKIDLEKKFNTIFLYHMRAIASNEGIAYLEKQFNKPQINSESHMEQTKMKI